MKKHSPRAPFALIFLIISHIMGAMLAKNYAPNYAPQKTSYASVFSTDVSISGVRVKLYGRTRKAFRAYAKGSKWRA